MATAVLQRPDVLVLASGGVLGEAWMTGVLAGMEEAGELDFRECDGFVGTSAGSIVAASLAAGDSPRRPRLGADGHHEDEGEREPAASALARGATAARRAASAAA